jgi:hypothetical protein
MAGLEKLRNVFHVIRAWLYPNYLEHGGRFIARAKTEKTLSIEQVCTEAVTRGGSDLHYDTVVDSVKAYFDEAAYQLADGYSIENPYYFVRPRIAGTFEHPNSTVDNEKNRVEFSFHPRQEMRSISDQITIEIEGVAESGSYIAEVQDVSSGKIDEKLTPNGVMVVLGCRIKIAGDDPSCGLYLVNIADGAALKVTGNFVENRPVRLSAQLPALPDGTYHVRIITQYASGALLKEPRQIDYEADLSVGGGGL